MVGIRAIATMHKREMNHTEEKYSRLLEDRLRAGEIHWWGFECLKLRLADKTWFTPDFVVVAGTFALECHEVKGFWKNAGHAGWQEDARIKIKTCAEIFPVKFIAAVLMPDGGWEFEEF